MKQQMKKYISLALALLLCVGLCAMGAMPVSAAETSGTCGNNLSWSLEGDTLTITGSGDMTDYMEINLPPWYEFREQISTLVLPGGLTSIGNLAFHGFSALESIRIPDSVTDIGWHAFDSCTSLKMLDLSDGLRRIQDGAFQNCTALKAVRLPEGLEFIGYQAFSRCESIAELTIPASVNELGLCAFAFCYNLIRAEVKANITVLPEWTFYGCGRLTEISLPETLTGVNEYAFYECESLTTVEYTGDTGSRQQIHSDIIRDLEGGGSTIAVGDVPMDENTVHSSVEEVDGDLVVTTTTVTQTDNASISTTVTVTYPDGDTDNGSSTVQVDITLENNSGWEEVDEYLDDALKSDGEVQINVYIKDESEVPAKVIDSMTNNEADVKVQTSSGAKWDVDGSVVDREQKGNSVGFSFQRSDATEEQLKKLSARAGYQIRFLQSANLNAQVSIKLPVEYAKTVATLYQVDGDELLLLQSVRVEKTGHARFYLASVDKDTEYLIGINVEGIDDSSVIIPEDLYDEYGITHNQGPIKYVITGHKSSWNMSIGQVTGIMIGALVAIVTVVGVMMYIFNKRKLKKGYVPDISEEDWEA